MNSSVSILFDRLQRQREKENNSGFANRHIRINAKDYSDPHLSTSGLRQNNSCSKNVDINTINTEEDSQRNTQKYVETYFFDLLEFYVRDDTAKGHFLKTHDVEQGLRARMIDWMIEVLSSYRFSNYSFFKAVDLMDRYFEYQTKCQSSNKMHLIGVTCIYMTSKLQEVDPLNLATITDKIAHRKLSERQILLKQTEIMTALNFNLMTNTIYDIAILMLHKLALKFRQLQQNIDAIEQIIAYIGKVTLYSYETIAKYSKQALGLGVLLLGLSCSNSITEHIKDTITNLCSPNNCSQALKSIAEIVINFQRDHPGLQNLKKFGKVEYKKLKSKLFMMDI